MVVLLLLGVFAVELELPSQAPQPRWPEEQKGIWTSEVKVLAEPLPAGTSLLGAEPAAFAPGRRRPSLCAGLCPGSSSYTDTSHPLPYSFGAASNTRSPSALKSGDPTGVGIGAFVELGAERSAPAWGDVWCPVLSAIRLPRW